MGITWRIKYAFALFIHSHSYLVKSPRFNNRQPYIADNKFDNVRYDSEKSAIIMLVPTQFHPKLSMLYG